jgi:hypothetical protein
MVIAGMNPGIVSCLISTDFSFGVTLTTTPFTWNVLGLVFWEEEASWFAEPGLHAVNPNPVTRTKMNKLAICLKCLTQQHVGKRDSLWQGEINNPEPCRPECTSISKAWQKRPLVLKNQLAWSESN